MDNGKFVYIENLLQALDEWFSAGNAPLNGGAFLFESDETVAEAISNAYHMMAEPQTPIKIIPRSQRRKIWQNQWGNWNGYIGKRRVMQFGTNERDARQWLSEAE
jgi:hypothetical protein